MKYKKDAKSHLTPIQQMLTKQLIFKREIYNVQLFFQKFMFFHFCLRGITRPILMYTIQIYHINGFSKAEKVFFIVNFATYVDLNFLLWIFLIFHGGYFGYKNWQFLFKKSFFFCFFFVFFVKICSYRCKILFYIFFCSSYGI